MVQNLRWYPWCLLKYLSVYLNIWLAWIYKQYLDYLVSKSTEHNVYMKFISYFVHFFSTQYPFSLVLTNPFIRFNVNCIRMWVISFLSFAMKNGYVNLRHFCKQYFLYISIYFTAPPPPLSLSPHTYSTYTRWSLCKDVAVRYIYKYGTKKKKCRMGLNALKKKRTSLPNAEWREVKSHFA